MLRITVHKSPGLLTFQLEGKLAGSLVHELEECWRKALSDASADDCQRTIRFDLSSVTSVDAVGKEFLAARYAAGDEFVAVGCLMKSIVAEVACSPVVIRRLTKP